MLKPSHTPNIPCNFESIQGRRESVRVNENKYKHLLYTDEVVMFTKPPRKRAAPEKTISPIKDSFAEEISKSSSNKKVKIEPKYFVFPETATPRNSEINELPQFAPVAIQEHNWMERKNSNCYTEKMQRSQLSINTELIPSPSFRITQGFINSPLVDYDYTDKREFIQPSPISAWLLSPLACRLHSFPNTPNVGCALNTEIEETARDVNGEKCIQSIVNHKN